MHSTLLPVTQDSTLIDSTLGVTDAAVETTMNQVNTTTTFFGFALADSMFAGNCNIERRSLTVEEVAARIARGVISCCNPSHEATIRAMRDRFGLSVSIPQAPPRVELRPGDSVIVMGVRGLPRLTDRHEYTDEEVAQATFLFSEYRVEGRVPVPAGFETDLSRINGG